MQKTLKYELDESYREGYNDAREEIAKEIENNCKGSYNHPICNHCEEATFIARGQK